MTFHHNLFTIVISTLLYNHYITLNYGKYLKKILLFTLGINNKAIMDDTVSWETAEGKSFMVTMEPPLGHC